MRLASFLLGLPLAATILVALLRGSRHLDGDWPVHAHHHLVAQIAGAVGLAVVSLFVLAVPLQRRERWAWWALLVAGVAGYGGFGLGSALVGLGSQRRQGDPDGALRPGLTLAWRELADA